MLDDYQQMQLGKMGDYLRWASLSSNMSDAPSIQDNLVRTHRMVHRQDKMNL